MWTGHEGELPRPTKLPTCTDSFGVCPQRVHSYNTTTTTTNNNNNLLQLGCHPVAVVILHVNKT